jgi:hypothetical protein
MVSTGRGEVVMFAVAKEGVCRMKVAVDAESIVCGMDFAVVVIGGANST